MAVLTDEQRRVRNRELLERSFSAVGNGDVAGQLETCTDDIVLELPYADPPVRLEGKDAIRAHVGPALEIFRFTLKITHLHGCLDPAMLVLEYTSVGEVTTTGKEYANSYVSVVR